MLFKIIKDEYNNYYKVWEVYQTSNYCNLKLINLLFYICKIKIIPPNNEFKSLYECIEDDINLILNNTNILNLKDIQNQYNIEFIQI